MSLSGTPSVRARIGAKRIPLTTPSTTRTPKAASEYPPPIGISRSSK
jgi:hypothetical protein